MIPEIIKPEDHARILNLLVGERLINSWPVDPQPAPNPGLFLPAEDYYIITRTSNEEFKLEYRNANLNFNI